MSEKTQYNLLTIAGFLFLLIGIFIFLEGGLHISTLKADELDKALPSGSYSFVMEDTSQKDVIVQVYQNENSNTYSVLEFSKNTLFPRYTLTEKHEMPKSKDTYCTVVSSALYVHAYFVDYQNMVVNIADSQISSTIHMILLFLFWGILYIVIGLWKIRQEKNIP